MPYFVWSGVTLQGTTKKGKAFARSVEELDKRLFKKEIALIRAVPDRSISLGFRVTIAQKGALFNQLVTLLDAGVLLPDALALVGGQQQDIRLQRAIFQVADEVHAGLSFSEALASQPHFFDSMIVQVVFVGQESGELTIALHALVAYLQMRATLAQKIRSALMVPMITFLFFLVMVGVILGFIVPSFAGLFTSLGKQLPAGTAALMRVSSFVRSWSMLAVIIGFVAVFYGLRALKKVDAVRDAWDEVVVKMPFVGRMVCFFSVTSFMQALALLVGGGMPLVQALEVAQVVVQNRWIAMQLVPLTENVAGGMALSDAMLHMPVEIFEPDVISLITVGEETGALDGLLARSAELYRERLVQALRTTILLVQPVVILILGLLVAVMIALVYVPMFNLADIV